MKNIILLLFIVMITTQGLKSQDSISTHQYRRSFWVDFGTGWGGQQWAHNFLIHGEVGKGKVLTYAYDNTRYDEFKEDKYGITSDSYNLMFGKVRKGKSGLIRFSVGVSLTKIKESKDIFIGYRCTILEELLGLPCNPTIKVYNEVITERSTIGIPLDLQLMLSTKWCGIGINPHVNLNPKFPYASLAIQASLERIR